MPKTQPDFSPEEQELFTRLGQPAVQCPPVDVLLALGQDVLPPDIETAASAHLATCPLCQMLTSDLHQLEPAPLTATEHQRIAAALPLERNNGSGMRMRWAFAIAATLLCALGLTLWKLHTASDAPDIAVTPASAPTVTAQLDLPSIPTAPLAPPTGATLSTRGAAGDEPSTEVLLPAFRSYNAGDYKKAEAAFQQLRPSFPKSNLVPLYLGVSQLLLHKPDEAARTLSNVNAHSSFADTAEWYRAVANSQTHKDSTRHDLQAICDHKQSRYSQQACTALAQTSHP